MKLDLELLWLTGVVVGLLTVATLLGWWLSQRVQEDGARATVANLNARTRAWWTMTAVFLLALATGGVGSIVLFGVTSFLALREFLSLTPTRLGDHRALAWPFFLVTPLQYVCPGSAGSGI